MDEEEEEVGKGQGRTRGNEEEGKGRGRTRGNEEEGKGQGRTRGNEEEGKGQGRTRENEEEGRLFPDSKICSKPITLYCFTLFSIIIIMKHHGAKRSVECHMGTNL